MMSRSLFILLFVSTGALGAPLVSNLRNTPTPNRYQIGDVWGKSRVTPFKIQTGSNAYQKAAHATAFIGTIGRGATAFYLGKFNGKHLAGTNHHVVQSEVCNKLKFLFIDAVPQIIPCARIVGHWTEVDFGLLEITPTPEQERMLTGQALTVDWDAELNFGTPLTTFGFGSAENIFQSDLMANEDSDCRVFSDGQDFRQIGDPDQLNPMDYRAWSFAHGCDISHGDSGSPILDRITGKLVGYVWTAATPKTPRSQTRDFLDSLLPSEPAIWEELAYGVPARKLGEFLHSLILNSKISEADQVAVERLLQGRAD